MHSISSLSHRYTLAFYASHLEKTRDLLLAEWGQLFGVKPASRPCREAHTYDLTSDGHCYRQSKTRALQARRIFAFCAWRHSGAKSAFPISSFQDSRNAFATCLKTNPRRLERAHAGRQRKAVPFPHRCTLQRAKHPTPLSRTKAVPATCNALSHLSPARTSFPQPEVSQLRGRP